MRPAVVIETPGIKTFWQPVVKPDNWLVPTLVMNNERMAA